MRTRDQIWRAKCKRLGLCLNCGQKNDDPTHSKCKRCIRWRTVLWNAAKLLKDDFK
jgi:hypothetical protein